MKRPVATNRLISVLFICLFLLFSHAVFAQSSTPNSSFPVADNTVQAMVRANDGTIYIGGSFTTVGGVSRNRIAAISSTGTVISSWNPNINNTVITLALSPDQLTLYVGGTFNGANSVGTSTRNYAAAIDVNPLSGTYGQATSWNPNAQSFVRSLTLNAAGTIIYAGGDFTIIGGQARNRLAALNNSTGAASSWNPGVTGGSFIVYKTVLSGDENTVYVGGSYTFIGGSGRNNIAAIDASSGLATSWNPNSNGDVYTLELNGTTLYTGGVFTTIGGQTRNAIAALDTTINTNNATSWNPNLTGASQYVFSLDLFNSTVYAGGSFTTAGGATTRNNIVALSTSTGSPTSWNPNANAPVYIVLATTSSVYIGGDFTTIGGSSRNFTAQFDFPTVTLAASPLSISEAGGVSTVTATLSGANSVDSTIGLSFGGTAINVTNYTRSATSITITAGSTTGAITITGVNDGVFNPSLTVIPSISTATNTIIGSPSSATITISNVNSTPTVTLTASPSSIASVSGTSTLTATLNAISGVNTVANLTYTGDAVRNTNYSAPNSITITAGSLTGTGTITRLTAPTVGPDLSVISTITSVDNNYATIGNPSSATVNLTNTTPSLSINNVTASEDAGTMTFTVTLSSSSSGTVTVDYATANGTATAGVNYVATSGTLTFNSGTTTQSIPITLINTSFGEGNTKTFTVNLSNPSGATISSATGTGTIQGVNPSGPPVNIEVVGGNNVTVGAEGAILTLIGSTTLTSPLYNWEIISGGVGFLTNANEQTAFYHIPPYPPTTTVTIRLTVTGTSASIGAKFSEKADGPLFQTTSDSSTTEINISGTGPIGGGGCNLSQTKDSFSIFYLLFSLLVGVSVFRIKKSSFLNNFRLTRRPKTL